MLSFIFIFLFFYTEIIFIVALGVFHFDKQIEISQLLTWLHPWWNIFEAEWGLLFISTIIQNNSIQKSYCSFNRICTVQVINFQLYMAE